MTDLQLTLNGRKYALRGPSAWKELTARQAVILMRFRQRVNDELPIIFPILELVYGLKPSQQKWFFDKAFLKKKGFSAEKINQALQYGQALIDTLRWIGETEPEATFLVPSFRLFDFQFGSAEILRKRAFHQTLYYAPSDGLANCCFGELIYSDQAYRAKNWPKLAAILCRPAAQKPTEEDSREAFDPSNFTGRAAQFADLDPALLSLIVAHYEASLRELQRYFPLIFPPSNPENSDAGSGSTIGWHKVAISMAKLDPTKVPQIEQVNLYLALEVLSEQIRQADELEEQLAQMRKK